MPARINFETDDTLELEIDFTSWLEKPIQHLVTVDLW